MLSQRGREIILGLKLSGKTLLLAWQSPWGTSWPSLPSKVPSMPPNSTKKLQWSSRWDLQPPPGLDRAYPCVQPHLLGGLCTCVEGSLVSNPIPSAAWTLAPCGRLAGVQSHLLHRAWTCAEGASELCMAGGPGLCVCLWTQLSALIIHPHGPGGTNSAPVWIL